MVSICFYFQVHQPYRLRRYSIFEINQNDKYFDESKNEEIIKRVATKCYLPANKLILDLIKKTNKKFKVSYSITGIALEQFEKYAPEVIETFKALARTGVVEFLNETYYHSLAFLYSKPEFIRQVEMHKQKIEKLFDYKPEVFRNTELIYNNELGNFIEDLGYKGILAEGADHILGWKSPNYLYRPIGCSKIILLLKNYKLSDDIAFRFGEKTWKEHPLTVEKFSEWVNSINGNGNLVNLFMDYETFGEHQWAQTGIFRFLKRLPEEILKNPDNDFVTPTEAIERYDTMDELDIHAPVSWADVERDLSAWIGNQMQEEALREIYRIEEDVMKSNDPVLIEKWRKLQTSDHFYYMCTKWFSDGDVHKYFNPYDSPYDGFVTFFNVLNDLSNRAKNRKVYNNEDFNKNQEIHIN